MGFRVVFCCEPDCVVRESIYGFVPARRRRRRQRIPDRVFHFSGRKHEMTKRAYYYSVAACYAVVLRALVEITRLNRARSRYDHYTGAYVSRARADRPETYVSSSPRSDIDVVRDDTSFAGRRAKWISVCPLRASVSFPSTRSVGIIIRAHNFEVSRRERSSRGTNASH